MQIAKYLGCLMLACLAVLAFYTTPTMACTCMPSHPQTSYCNADYAILVKVLRKKMILETNQVAYKVKIRKTYKITNEDRKTLRDNRLVTQLEDAACGVNLILGKTYVIASQGPELSLCNYIKEYKTMTNIERSGFSRGYRHACKCAVKPCFGDSCLKNVETKSGCKWSPFDICETEFGVCWPSTDRKSNATQCRWLQTSEYKKCLLNRNHS